MRDNVWASSTNLEISQSKSIEMDTHFSTKQRAAARALTLTLEHHLYWLILIFRWVHEEGRFMQNVFSSSHEDSLMSKVKGYFTRRRLSIVAAKVFWYVLKESYNIEIPYSRYQILATLI